MTGMKNGMLIWNGLLTLVAGFFLITHFTSKSKKVNKQGITDSRSFADSNHFRIAYFEMDSVAANYDKVKEVKSELAKKENEITAELDRLNKNLQDRYIYFQNQAQAGTLSETDSEKASRELEKMNEDMKARKAKLDQEYFELRTRKETDIKIKIEEFCKEFNQDKKYNYIISYEQGLFFYKDTAYNITKELVQGLNDQHRTGKKN
jgi:outer membrane protein